jgi:hypothetical protein
MNLVICKKDGTVFRVVKNAIRKGKRVEGDNGRWEGKPELFDLIWTEQELTPIFKEDNKSGVQEFIGYKETKSDITPTPPPKGCEQPENLNRGQRIAMLERLEDLADKDFNDIDDYINNNVTNLAEAKAFMKTQAKVTLAIIKLLQDTMR